MYILKRITQKNRPQEIIELHNEIKSEMLDFGPIKIDPQKLYIVSKGKNNIIDVELQNKKLKIHINLKKGQLEDPENLCIDQSSSGHWGNGDYRIDLPNLDKREYVMYLFKQSFDYNV